MNPASDDPKLTSKFIRLASVELRFAKEKKYLNAVNLYCQLLGLTPLPDPKHVQPSYHYPIGEGDQAMELRFVLKTSSDDTKKNRAVMYWQVPSDEIIAIHKDLCALPEYKSVEPVTSSPNSVKPDTQRSVIEDPSGNLFGLIGNPPFPLM